MNCWMSCTHSKYDTVTPPALHSTSGMTKMSLLARTSSASGVVGPFAPSARMRHLSSAAFSPVMTRSSAAGTRTRARRNVSSSCGIDGVGRRESRRPFSARCWVGRRKPVQRGDVDAPLVADRAVAVADGDDLDAELVQFLASHRADVAETLDDGRRLAGADASVPPALRGCSRRRRGRWPRARPTQPPSSTGLPVTISGQA